MKSYFFEGLINPNLFWGRCQIRTRLKRLWHLQSRLILGRSGNGISAVRKRPWLTHSHSLKPIRDDTYARGPSINLKEGISKIFFTSVSLASVRSACKSQIGLNPLQLNTSASYSSSSPSWNTVSRGPSCPMRPWLLLRRLRSSRVDIYRSPLPTLSRRVGGLAKWAAKQVKIFLNPTLTSFPLLRNVTLINFSKDMRWYVYWNDGWAS